ncbi:MAG: L-threonylcarbamoyladenylate synthase [Patescibacteria group bacterium]
MQLLSIDLKKPSPAIINQALAVLMAGGVVVYPTDTAYGLAVDATNEEAIGKLFVIKRRAQKALPVLVTGMLMAKQLVEVDPVAHALMKTYWPGAVTFILPHKKTLPPALLLGKPGLGVRQADQPIAQALVRGLGRPITSTSANLSGAGVFYSGQEVARHFAQQPMQPDMVLDAGDIPEEPPSTIIDLVARPPVVLRQGAVRVQLGKRTTAKPALRTKR